MKLEFGLTRIWKSVETRIWTPELECDASRESLRTTLKQLDLEGWKTVAFALNWNFLGLARAIEYFKYYSFGQKYTVITDHRALLSIWKECRSNKFFNSRHTRWADQLFAFNFETEHLPCTKMCLVHYISRKPSPLAANTTNYDDQFVVAKLDLVKRSAKRFPLNKSNYESTAPPIETNQKKRHHLIKQIETNHLQTKTPKKTRIQSKMLISRCE